MSKREVTGHAMGRNGQIDYQVTVADNRITDLKVLNHSETPGIFNQVIDQLKNDVVSHQSFDVDAISGATVMSRAILDSANQAVTAAGVDITPAPQPQTAPETQRLTTDVLVIGGGEAGLVAACRALTEDRQVTLVEKNGYLGGATILNGSNVVATGSKLTKRVLGDQGDTPAKLAADVARESKDTNVPALTDLMVHQIGPAMDFISQFANLPYQKAQTQTPEHSVTRQIELPSASSYELIQKVAAAFTAAGGQLLLDTRVEALTFDDQHQLNGVVAKQHAKTVEITAQAVVLASGGHGANQKMRTAESQGIDYYGPATSTGDAYAFNQALDLKTHDLDWYKIYPHGVEVAPGTAKLTTYASKQATDMGALYVNVHGKRIVNESDVYTTFRDAILKQDGQVAYLVMDARTWKQVYQLMVLHDFSAEEIQGYFDHPEQRPIFVKGNLQTVARQAGIDGDQLAETVKRYEASVQAGHDDDFNRDPQYLHAFEGDLFYVIEQRDRFATTLGGYSVDPQTLQLLTNAGTPVANYFGAGEVIGGANGHDSMPSMMNTWGIASGYVAGKMASEKVRV